MLKRLKCRCTTTGKCGRATGRSWGKGSLKKSGAVGQASSFKLQVRVIMILVDSPNLKWLLILLTATGARGRRQATWAIGQNTLIGASSFSLLSFSTVSTGRWPLYSKPRTRPRVTRSFHRANDTIKTLARLGSTLL